MSTERLRTVSYQLSLLFGVAEGEGDFGFDVGRSPLSGHHVDQQVDQYVVVLQQRDAAVPVVEGHVGPDGADVGVDLTRVTLHDGLKRGSVSGREETHKRPIRAEEPVDL